MFIIPRRKLLVAGQQLFTTPGTVNWIVPPRVRRISILGIAAGGGGKYGGGGGGAYAYRNDVAVTPGDTLAIGVGASASGGAGGNSFVGSLFSVGGGASGGTGGGNGGTVGLGTGHSGGSGSAYTSTTSGGGSSTETQGPFYVKGGVSYVWQVYTGSGANTAIFWNGPAVATGLSIGITSYSSGGWIYTRGASRENNGTYYYYEVSRHRTVSNPPVTTYKAGNGGSAGKSTANGANGATATSSTGSAGTGTALGSSGGSYGAGGRGITSGTDSVGTNGAVKLIWGKGKSFPSNDA